MAGGWEGIHVSKTTVDKIKHSFWVEKGPFAASRLPSTLPLTKRTLETDAKLLQAQQNWHLEGAIICKSITLVGSVTQELSQLAALEDPIGPQDLTDICH